MPRRSASLLALAACLLVPAARADPDELAAKLRSPDAQVRWRAAWDLARLGKKAEPAGAALVERLGDEDRTVRFAAAVALGWP